MGTQNQLLNQIAGKDTRRIKEVEFKMKPTIAIKENANKWFLDFAEKNIGEGKKYRYVRDFCKAIDYHEYNFNGLKSGLRKVPVETVIYTCKVHGIPYEKVFGKVKNIPEMSPK